MRPIKVGDCPIRVSVERIALGRESDIRQVRFAAARRAAGISRSVVDRLRESVSGIELQVHLKAVSSRLIWAE